LYLGIKCVLLVLLVCLWWRVFLREQFNVWFLPFCLLAFNGATSLDFISGNFQLFELAILWLAFTCFVKGYDLAFGVLILVAASIKLTPIAFLALWLAFPSRRRLIYLVVFSCLFGLLILAGQWAWPELFEEFVRSAGSMAAAPNERREYNPALLPLIQDIAGPLIGRLQPPLLNRVATVIYLAAAGVILLFSALVCRRIRASDPEQHRRLVLFLGCLAYALTVPRMKQYSYMLLLPPAFYTLVTSGPLRSSVVVFVLLLLPANRPTGYQPFETVYALLQGYYLLFTVALLWGLFCWQVWYPPSPTATDGYRTDLGRADNPESAACLQPVRVALI
jgi:hypothetical protein